MSKNYTKHEVLEIIEKTAEQRNIPKDDFIRFAYIETGGRFDEQASRGVHGAKGLFQFIPSTAERYGIAGRELDAVANTDAAARLYLDNQRAMINAHDKKGLPYLSGEPRPDGLDMYMAHQQGSAGYSSIQNAMINGSFTREDTRRNILNNVSERDIESVIGVSKQEFGKFSDQALANHFVRYWDIKFDRISIPEFGIEPRATTPRTLVSQTDAISTAAQEVLLPSASLIKHGESGSEIKAMQELMSKFGYRDAQGHLLNPDGDFGQKTKEAVQAFQRAHGLDDDGIIGVKTMEALKRAEQSPLLSSPNHPDHRLYQQALAGIEKLPPNSFQNDLERQNAAASIVFEAKVSGLRQIDNVVLSHNGNGIFAIQGAMNDPAHHRIHIDKNQAAVEPIEKSTVQIQQEIQTPSQQVESEQRRVRMA